jgi:hypothetical protein
MASGSECLLCELILANRFFRYLLSSQSPFQIMTLFPP